MQAFSASNKPYKIVVPRPPFRHLTTPTSILTSTQTFTFFSLSQTLTNSTLNYELHHRIRFRRPRPWSRFFRVGLLFPEPSSHADRHPDSPCGPRHVNGRYREESYRAVTAEDSPGLHCLL
ncbi:unnamed protein product [Chondrus crispus]|uniref:Uncharacterized protein n=1 Tax=Chondrus crispus TaxID=2769 RepID=R7QIU6_CHOCR|nr:unnamed protein product [Chondrus crispus]CDF37683.1 unnamed protein product [Chondrus crispus]|eukprot:XP_005717554.1 unnamed protein product [Chondrus crispus]